MTINLDELNIRTKENEILKDRLFKCLTYKEIGEKWGKSTERIRQIIMKLYMQLCWKNNKRSPSYITISQLSYRVQKCLLTANIKSIRQLRNISMNKLLNIKNLGKYGLKEILILLGRKDDLQNI